MPNRAVFAVLVATDGSRPARVAVAAAVRFPWSQGARGYGVLARSRPPRRGWPHSVTPYIAKKTGATVIGTESTINLARAGRVPESQLLAVHGGEDWQFDGFSVKVIPSLHSALNGKHFFDSRVVPRDFRGPRRLGTDVEGGTAGVHVGAVAPGGSNA